jgi:integrase
MARADDEGTIYEYPKGSGIWWAQLPADEQGKRPKRRAASQKEALEKLRELWAERSQGVDLTMKQPTVAEFLNFWLEHVIKPKKRPGTYENYVKDVRLHIIPVLGTTRLKKLRGPQIQRWVNGLTMKSACNPYQRLRAALDVAVRWGYIPKNYARDVESPSYTPPAIAPLTEKQAIALLDAAAGDRLAPLYEIAIWLGLRESELLGLRWADIDLKKRTLSVTGQIVRRRRPSNKTYLVRHPPKSKKSERTIPLSDGLCATLKAHHARLAAERLKAGPAWRDHDLLFPTLIGTPIDHAALRAHFKRLVSAAELPATTRVHDLRHTAASLMLDNGATIADVSSILGHANPAITARIYAHSYDEGQRRAVEGMERRLRRGQK